MSQPSVDPDQRFLFVHLQKTAGTALLRRLRHHFGTDSVYPTPEQQGSSQVVLDVDLLLDRVASADQTFRVITGHFPLATADLLSGPVSTFTVLRDPVERVLSFLRHQRDVEPRFADRSLEEIYDDPISTGPLVRDHMVRMLSLTAEEMTAGALSPMTVDEERLERACTNLQEKIDVMGLQERFDVFCEDLETTFGWDLGERVFMNRSRPIEAPSGLRERIDADSLNDRRLYDEAVRLWRTRHP